MTRRWLVSCGAFSIGTMLVAVAWSESPPTLAERIQQLRRGWTGDATADTPATTPSAGSTSTSPKAKTGTKPTAPMPAKQDGVPQVDAGSLVPTQLFSRPSSAIPSGARPAATPANQRVTTASPHPSNLMPRTSTQSRAATNSAGTAAADKFTLPGLGSPASNANRAATSPPPKPHTNVAQKNTAPAAPSTVARRQPTAPTVINALPSTGKSDDRVAVRRSPELRTPVHLDPESLRDELPEPVAAPANEEHAAGPATKSEEHSADAKPSILGDAATRDDDKAREAFTFHDTASSGSESPKSDEPITPVARPKPLKRDAKAGTSNSGPKLSSDDDRYQEHGLSPMTPPTKSDATDEPSFGEGLNLKPGSKDAAARAFDVAPKASAVSKQMAPSADPRGRFADDKAAAATGTGVLVTNQAPVITSDIRGPQQIAIGREASYRLQLKNKGAVPAEGLVANLHIPSWAEIVSTTPSQGSIRQGEGTDTTAGLQWEIPRLEAQATETLDLVLIPRASRPLEMGVTWTCAPVDARAVVEVQEPKLQMSVSGPDEVLYGKPHVYRLTLSNPGTGTAQNVQIGLKPPGGNEQSISTQRLGDLAVGASKTMEVELIAREAGKLNVEATATADGGLTAEATKELFCRKPELEVDWRGPEMQYAGTPATYFFRVRNPGTAAADNVAVRVTLPAGAEFVSGSEGYAKDSAQGDILWRVGTLGPGDDCYMELRAIARTPGDNQVKVAAATAAGDLSDRKVATTRVVALADLTLDVSDPPGPVLVGDEALYEIRIHNRGSSAAEEVNVVGLFSDGLDPETVEGAPYSVADGRVSFRTIHKIPAGQKILLQIRARGSRPGTHVFRAEVLCRDLEIKLAAEETTRFYQNEVSSSQPPTAQAETPTRQLGALR